MPLPSGFKNREDYNKYMREYRKREKIKQLAVNAFWYGYATYRNMIMPKLTRKYPSKKKTTTKEGYREYKKLQMRVHRERKRAEFNQLKEENRRLKQQLASS